MYAKTAKTTIAKTQKKSHKQIPHTKKTPYYATLYSDTCKILQQIINCSQPQNTSISNFFVKI